jgi:hypothetical protein
VQKILSPRMFTILVIMAIATTAMTSPIVHYLWMKPLKEGRIPGHEFTKPRTTTSLPASGFSSQRINSNGDEEEEEDERDRKHTLIFSVRLPDEEPFKSKASSLLELRDVLADSKSFHESALSAVKVDTV